MGICSKYHGFGEYSSFTEFFGGSQANQGVVAVNDIDRWDDESASDYTVVRCSNEA